MNYYLAPLEGTTSFIYRSIFHKYYGDGITKYFIPFIETHIKRDFNARERNDLLPEHNAGMQAIPQVLTKDPEAYFLTERSLMEFGYREVNLNLGCPSGTVTANGRGAGMLKDVAGLDHFLEEIFAGTNMQISIKTRIGMKDPDEFAKILEVYNKYPLTELIIHPRLQAEQYRGNVHLDVFRYALEHTKHKLCYNGDITSADTYHKIMEIISEGYTPQELSERCPSVMIGRGLIAQPDLVMHLNGDTSRPETFCRFHDELLDAYSEFLSGDRNVLFRMKELWGFWQAQFPDAKKELKAIRKAQTVSAYRVAAAKLLR